MVGTFASPFKSALAAGVIAAAATCAPAQAADIVVDPDSYNPNMLDPTPVAQRLPAVDGINFQASAVTGVIGGYSNSMFIASVATPMPYFNQFGAQLDLGIGMYRHSYTSAAAGLHLFWRDPSVAMLGIYGDWGYVNPEHAGRVGVEAALYNGNWTLEGLAGVTFGQDVETEFFDEVDLTYYFSSEFKGAIGHRFTTRGNVGNLSFEYLPVPGSGWSVYGEAEAGEDSYYGAWLGLRYAFGAAGARSLIDRDRGSSARVRIPRNLASVTRCGSIANPANYHSSWNGFEHTPSGTICGSKSDLNKYGAVEVKQ